MSYDTEFDSPEEGEEGYKAPCPADWFAETGEEISLAELMNCSVFDVMEKCPLEVRQRYLSYKSVVDKARPYLEQIARDRAKHEAGGGDTMS